jgi:hypothetical protein
VCYNCDNGVIMKINDIMALLFTLSHLLHYYSNSRVGPRALLASKHVMTLLYPLLEIYSIYHMAYLITLL